MADCIHVTGIRAYGYTGVFPEEQTLGQWYQVDLTFWLDLSQAGQSDRLEHTYDYGSDIRKIVELMRTAKFALIERLAEAIAEIALQSDKVEQVKVHLTKLNPPIPDFLGQVAVEITRSRQSNA